MAAAAASTLQASHGASAVPSAMWYKKWSPAQIESKPRSSMTRIMAASSGHFTGRSISGSWTPTLSGRRRTASGADTRELPPAEKRREPGVERAGRFDDRLGHDPDRAGRIRRRRRNGRIDREGNLSGQTQQIPVGGRGYEPRLLDQLELGLERVDVLLEGGVARLQRVGLTCCGCGVARLIGKDADEPDDHESGHEHGAFTSGESQTRDRLEGTVGSGVVCVEVRLASCHG